MTHEELPRFKVEVVWGEGDTIYHVVDTAQPLDEQPAIILSCRLSSEPNARYLACDFCRRHNAKARK